MNDRDGSFRPKRMSEMTEKKSATELLHAWNRRAGESILAIERVLNKQASSLAKATTNVWLLKEGEDATLNYTLVLQSRINRLLLALSEAKTLIEPLITIEEALAMVSGDKPPPPPPPPEDTNVVP